jgi:hypothetical protein
MLEPSRHISGMTNKHPRRPRDPNQLAKRVVDLATGEAQDIDPDPNKNPQRTPLGPKITSLDPYNPIVPPYAPWSG